VRAYMTGSTDTSIWKNYQNGCRNYCGHALPEGLKKNTKIANGPILTPTTKGVKDRPISVAEIIEEKLMTKEVSIMQQHHHHHRHRHRRRRRRRRLHHRFRKNYFNR